MQNPDALDTSETISLPRPVVLRTEDLSQIVAAGLSETVGVLPAALVTNLTTRGGPMAGPFTLFT